MCAIFLKVSPIKVYLPERERERERKGERETEREIGRKRDRQTDRERDRKGRERKTKYAHRQRKTRIGEKVSRCMYM